MNSAPSLHLARAVDAAVTFLLTGRARPLHASAAGKGSHQEAVAQPEGRGANQCATSLSCPAGKCPGRAGMCGPCLVYVTSSAQDGALGGLAGADAICQMLAQDASLPGTYRAWLSDGVSSPSTRFTRATSTYTLIDGTVIAENWAQLTSGSLRCAIDLAETGSHGAVMGDTVWSNTLPDGTPAGTSPGEHCAGWTSAEGTDDGHIGDPFATDANWTHIGTRMFCLITQRLYCFQQPEV
jgi:hypothetical protein